MENKPLGLLSWMVSLNITPRAGKTINIPLNLSCRNSGGIQTLWIKQQRRKHELGPHRLFDKVSRPDRIRLACFGEERNPFICRVPVNLIPCERSSSKHLKINDSACSGTVCVCVCVCVVCCCRARSSTKVKMEQSCEVLIDTIGYLKMSISSGARWECRASSTTLWSDGDTQPALCHRSDSGGPAGPQAELHAVHIGPPRDVRRWNIFRPQTPWAKQWPPEKKF